MYLGNQEIIRLRKSKMKAWLRAIGITALIFLITTLVFVCIWATVALAAYAGPVPSVIVSIAAAFIGITILFKYLGD